MERGWGLGAMEVHGTKNSNTVIVLLDSLVFKLCAFIILSKNLKYFLKWDISDFAKDSAKFASFYIVISTMECHVVFKSNNHMDQISIHRDIYKIWFKNGKVEKWNTE